MAAIVLATDIAGTTACMHGLAVGGCPAQRIVISAPAKAGATDCAAIEMATNTRIRL
jgi:uncharacterized protein YgbK (DUF1537 family)